MTLERGIVGDLLHFFCQGFDVAVGDDESFAAVGEEVFGPSGCCGEDRASAGHGLTLNECEALFDAGKNEEMAGAHFFCQLRLGDRTGEGDVFGGEGGKKGTDVVLNGSYYGEVFLWVLQACERLKEVGDSFAEANLSGEEKFEEVLWRLFGAGELVEDGLRRG